MAKIVFVSGLHDGEKNISVAHQEKLLQTGYPDAKITSFSWTVKTQQVLNAIGKDKTI